VLTLAGLLFHLPLLKVPVADVALDVIERRVYSYFIIPTAADFFCSLRKEDSATPAVFLLDALRAIALGRATLSTIGNKECQRRQCETDRDLSGSFEKQEAGVRRRLVSTLVVFQRKRGL
jgi:hypothetical protein